MKHKIPLKKNRPEKTIPTEKHMDALLKLLSRNNSDIDPDRIRKAFELLKSCTSHSTDSDASQIMEHAIEAAQILAEINADEQTIIASLVHDLLSQGCSNDSEIEAQFGQDVLILVQKATQTSRIKFKSRIEEQAEYFRKMILAMAQDLRVILLYLAKRLQLMRTLLRTGDPAQREIALETLEIYAPLANRLGIARIKWEMEDLCLKVLHPSIYHELEERVPQDRKQRKSYINKVIKIVEKEMADQNIPGEVVGRPKHFYSIYQKIVKRGVSFDEIFDLTALRIMTENTSHCYAILGMIHALWKPVPGRFKDYIGVPKTNMYQSLHTTVIGPEGQKVEIQIRTHEMHRIAEKGIAAHWKYKEGRKSEETQEQKFAWLRQLLEWQQELKSPREFMESVKTDLFEESVYVFTPNGDVRELPSGSTPLDFAYSIHSDVGNRCTGAKVNDRMVPLRSTLKTGDTLKILTSKNQMPSKDWLKIVKTTKAKNRIRHFLNQEEQKQSLSLGHEILEKEARKHGLVLSRIFKNDEMNHVVSELGFKQLDKLIASVGFGKISARQVLNRFVPAEEVPEEPPIKIRKTARKKKDGIKVRGIGDILVHFSRCCSPVPGDEIIGFITRGKGVSIHRMDCANVGGGINHSDRLIDVDWDISEESVRPVLISVLTNNRPGILASISAKISSDNINISAADIRVRKDGHSLCRFELEIRHRTDLDQILSAISRLKDVLEVKRISGVA